jgi:hypothetical protein
MVRHIAIFIVLILVCDSSKSADWKFIGKSGIGGKKYYSFYDNQTKENIKQGHISIWVKFLSIEEVDSIAKYYEDTLIHLVAKKIAFYYSPPYVLAQSDTTDYLGRCIDITQLEVVATNFDPSTKLKIRYEFNCKQRKMKTLKSIIYDSNGESVSNLSKEGEWEDIAPETVGEVMMKVICRNLK